MVDRHTPHHTDRPAQMLHKHEDTVTWAWVWHIYIQTHTAERLLMTAWCCFVLLMLISVNKATAGTACSITQIHAPHYTLWCPGGIWRVLELCILSLSRQPHHMEIWEEQRVCQGACTEYNQAAPYWRPSPALSFTHIHSYSCTQWECAGDQWSVKWFCYHVVCVEYIFPSSFHGRCAWWACGAGVFWGVHLVSVSICYWARRVEAVHVQTSISSSSSAFVIWHRETPTPKYSKYFFWAQCIWGLWILLDLYFTLE